MMTRMIFGGPGSLYYHLVGWLVRHLPGNDFATSHLYLHTAAHRCDFTWCSKLLNTMYWTTRFFVLLMQHCVVMLCIVVHSAVQWVLTSICITSSFYNAQDVDSNAGCTNLRFTLLIASDDLGQQIASDYLGQQMASENLGQQIASDNSGKQIASKRQCTQ